MRNAILQARKAHRQAVESTYEHTCTIKEFQPVKDPITKITKNQETIVIEDKPCRISYETVKQANQTKSNATVQQIIKLFIAPEITVKEGSRIIVTHEGIVDEFKHTGMPSIYFSHQEIVLERAGNT